MRFSVRSDTGLIRTVNEDSFFIKSSYENLPDIYIIADGMGGHNAGEIASKTAAEYTGEVLLNTPGAFLEEENLTASIIEAMEKANQKVFEMSKAKSENSGMGTTLIAAVVYGKKLYIGHIGDSRVYILKKGIISKITSDHSLVEELLRSGTLTKEEAENHPKKNIITRAIGCSVVIDVDLYEYDIENGDIILMCTDGLTNMVNENQIRDIVQNSKDLGTASENLINKANENGGEDNTTVILFRIDGVD
ncbi:MAG: Stp1/IreP family PP2C-type Ser/Thr phosphatase [Clostridiales bacterium]